MAKKENRHAEHFDKLSASLVSASANIDAPYELPEGWEWCRLMDCASVISKGTTPKGGKDAYLKEGVNFLRIENLNDDGSINLSNISHISVEEHEGNLKRSILIEGDLLISIAGTLGKVGFVTKADLPMNTNQAIAFVRLHKDIFDNKYLKYAIESPFVNAELLTKTKVTSIPNLTLEIISNCLTPLPPTLAEQQRIVNRIETMFAKLDQAQEKAQTVLDSFETRKAAILHKAFNGQLKIDNEELTIDDWEEKSFSELGTTNLGKMLDANKNTGDDVQYLRNINVRWFDFDLSDLMTMKAKPEEIKKLSVKKGDLFICEGGEPGWCAVWKDVDTDMIFQKAIHRFRPNEETSCEFVAYELYYLNQIGKLSDYFTGTTIKHLTGQSLAKLPIKLPPLNYQLSIVNFLDIVLEKESRAKEAAQTVLEQIALLKKSILARAFRGEL